MLRELVLAIGIPLLVPISVLHRDADGELELFCVVGKCERPHEGPFDRVKDNNGPRLSACASVAHSGMSDHSLN